MEAEENYILKYEMLKCWALICFRWKFPREWVCLIWMSDFSNLLPTQSDNLICIYPAQDTRHTTILPSPLGTIPVRMLRHVTLTVTVQCSTVQNCTVLYLCRGVLPLVDSPVAGAGHVACRPRVGDGGVLLLWYTEYGENNFGKSHNS